MKKIIANGIVILFILASIFPVVNAEPNENEENNLPVKLLSLPRPSPFVPFTAFTLDFYQPASTIFNLTVLNLIEINLISTTFDSSDDPVGKLEYLKITGGALTTVEFKNFMTIGIIALGNNYDDSDFNKETGLGSITGTAIFFGYIGR